MDLNKSPEMYKKEVDEYYNLEEEYNKKKEMESADCYSRGWPIYIVLAVVGLVTWFMAVSMDFESTFLAYFSAFGIPVVFIVIGMIIAYMKGSAADEEIKRRHKELEAERERKCAEYAIQFDREVYAKSIEMQKNVVVDEICDLMMPSALEIISTTDRSNTKSQVRAEFRFEIWLNLIRYSTILYDKSITFQALRVKDLPDCAKAEVLARTIAEKLKRRLENTYPRDIKCGTPVTIIIERRGRKEWDSEESRYYFSSRVKWDVIYTAPNSNYVQSRAW